MVQIRHSQMRIQTLSHSLTLNLFVKMYLCIIVYCIEYRLAADLLFIIIIQSRGTIRLIPRDLSGFDFDLDEVWTPSDNTATKASGTPVHTFWR